MGTDASTGTSTYAERLKSLVRLKDYAVDKRYSIPPKLIADIAQLELKFLKSEPRPEFSADDVANLDQLTIDLSEVTFPINISNISKLVDGKIGISPFVYWVLGFGLVAALLSGWLGWAIAQSGSYAGIAQAGLPVLLGMVGAIIYVMLPNGRLNVAVGVDAENIADTIVRVVMGGLLGFVLYVVIRFLAKSGASAPGIDSSTLFLPLLGGYSVTLVVGVLAKAVAALQLTFNIDEKSIRASLYK
jgi:hypothetical protein